MPHTQLVSEVLRFKTAQKASLFQVVLLQSLIALQICSKVCKVIAKTFLTLSGLDLSLETCILPCLPDSDLGIHPAHLRA